MFSSSLKVGKSCVRGNQAGEIVSYLQEAFCSIQAFIVCIRLIHITGVMYFTQSTDLNGNIIRKHSRNTFRIMFDQISGHPMACKLTHKIKHHTILYIIPTSYCILCSLLFIGSFHSLKMPNIFYLRKILPINHKTPYFKPMLSLTVILHISPSLHTKSFSVFSHCCHCLIHNVTLRFMHPQLHPNQI